MQAVDNSKAQISKTRGSLLFGAAIAAPLTLAVWWAIPHYMPAIASMENVSDRLIFALKCSCVAILLCLMSGVEAVSHRRLFSPAIDPLAGREDGGLRIDLRYLQNTLEQTVLFVPGLFGLAVYQSDMRLLLAATLVWVLSRLVFWIVYHIGPQHRAAGLTGMVQSMLILLYVSWKFGTELAGVWGGVAIPGLFGFMELVFFIAAIRAGQNLDRRGE